MRSRHEVMSPRRARQQGFSLLEVMFASMILSVFILGIGGFWYSASSRASDLVLKQKAIFVLNGEMERISALYVFSGFAADLLNGPVSTSGYDGLAAIPATRLVYPDGIGAYASNDYVTTSATTFAGSDFYVLLQSNLFSSLNRTYVWIDRHRNIAARLSWVATNISVGSCIQLLDCSCQPADNLLLENQCKQLAVFLEFPYRIDASGTVAPPATLQTLSLKTIVGRA
jgi:prepilin-type N-terminal cleavage/methylation domain-containing protein